MRTIVLSDLHGSASRLERALAHAGYGPDDSVVIAGDLIDVGDDDTIGMAEALGATVLAGNHEVSAALGLRITPQNASSRLMAPEFARRLASGEWPLAVAVDGWLVTHAGVSSALDDIVSRTDGSASEVAAMLNEIFRDEFTRAVRSMPLSWEDLTRFRLIGGEMGPLWFRPLGTGHLPAGLRQIVGHTPPESLPSRTVAALEQHGWLLVEPGGHAGEGMLFRYAVVADGQAAVVAG